MPSVSFYLQGESPSTARLIDVPEAIDEESLQHIIASNFAIVQHEGGYPI
jgi:hypothetical protein